MNLTEFQRTVIFSALFVTGAAILILLGISLLSSPQPEASAQFNLTVSDHQVRITHTGGEPLECGKLAILVNGEVIAFPSVSSTECPWSIGESLVIPRSPIASAQAIRITYDEGKGPYEIMYSEIPGKASDTAIPKIPVLTPSALTLTSAPHSSPAPTSTPGIPSASFSASPRSGSVPLIVQFTDTSTGVPEEWTWSFGDGKGSTEEDPVHVYSTIGSFQVSLSVNNTYGAHTRIANGYINVTPAVGRDVFIEADRGGSVVPGGFLEFTVVSPAARMKIGGQVQELEPGDRIRLVVEGNGKGKISVQNGAILEYSFEEVSLYRDGQRIAEGSVREISVSGTEGFISSLRLVIPHGPGSVRLLEEGAPKPVPEPGSALVADSLQPGRDRMMILDCSRPDSTYFRGTANLIPI
jgi:PKD repeat protein